MQFHVFKAQRSLCKPLINNHIVFKLFLYTPVVALLAELLLEVAKGETVALHGPPVGDLLATEEICHHCLATANSIASEPLLALLHPERDRKDM